MPGLAFFSTCVSSRSSELRSKHPIATQIQGIDLEPESSSGNALGFPVLNLRQHDNARCLFRQLGAPTQQPNGGW